MKILVLGVLLLGSHFALSQHNTGFSDQKTKLEVKRANKQIAYFQKRIKEEKQRLYGLVEKEIALRARTDLTASKINFLQDNLISQQQRIKKELTNLTRMLKEKEDYKKVLREEKVIQTVAELEHLEHSGLSFENCYPATDMSILLDLKDSLTERCSSFINNLQRFFDSDTKSPYPGVTQEEDKETGSY